MYPVILLRKNWRSLEHKTRDSNTNKTGSTTSKEWTTPDCRNTPSATNLEEEEIVDAPGNDGSASMLEQVKRPNPWRKLMMMMMMTMYLFVHFVFGMQRGCCNWTNLFCSVICGSSFTAVDRLAENFTRTARKVSSHFEYLENRPRSFNVTRQPVRRDLTVHLLTVTLPWG